MYDLKQCPLCNKQYLEDTAVIEYHIHENSGKYYYDMKHGDWCLPRDMHNRILQQIDRIFRDGMTLKELCMRLMEYFNLTASTACNYTRWLVNTMPVYLPDRKHIRLIPA
jgi:hypothetical protein